MFGFNKRKRFNGDVDVKLNNEYQIATRNNPDFPGMSVYLELLDTAWSSKMNADEAALYIAVLLYSGFVKHGDFYKAQELLANIERVASFGLSKGFIAQARWERFSVAIEEGKLTTLKHQEAEQF